MTDESINQEGNTTLIGMLTGLIDHTSSTAFLFLKVLAHYFFSVKFLDSLFQHAKYL